MLKVIGTGFGRTGTKSLKLALEQLGSGPCHHMSEVRWQPEQVPYWQSVARGEVVDWDVVFTNYSACVDWPACHYWRQLCSKYPKAKVIHTVRDEQQWIASMYQTIYPRLQNIMDLEDEHERERLSMAYDIIINQTFDGRLDDREHAIEVFRAHTDEVVRTIAAERLLVFDVRQGWEPLCRFLGTAIPDTPFPKVNSTAEYQNKKYRAQQ